MPTATLRNNYHARETSVRYEPGRDLSRDQVRRIRSVLCGISDCRCGGDLSERGPQDVAIVPVGVRDDGSYRIQIVDASGPGRPHGPDGKGRAVRIYAPASILAALDREAQRRGMTRSSAIVDAVKAWLSD